MDWLRSEDLNEEKNVTTPFHYYSSPMHSVVAKWCKGVPLAMSNLHPECLNSESRDHWVADDVLLRQEPDEEEDEEEDEGNGKENDDEDGDDEDDGYSE